MGVLRINIVHNGAASSQQKFFPKLGTSLRKTTLPNKTPGSFDDEIIYRIQKQSSGGVLQKIA